MPINATKRNANTRGNPIKIMSHFSGTLIHVKISDINENILLDITLIHANITPAYTLKSDKTHVTFQRNANTRENL
jgi:hypothetical protein